jgi:hypothetical protein
LLLLLPLTLLLLLPLTLLLPLPLLSTFQISSSVTDKPADPGL